MDFEELAEPTGGGKWRETDEVTIPRDYTEEFLQAIDLMVKTRLQDVKFDTTIECTILDTSEATTNYRYLVSNGSAKFYAYSESIYYENDIVYVNVPNNDYGDIKIIIGKKVNNATTPYKYTKPFDTFVDVTGNVIHGILDETGKWQSADKVTSLIANDPAPYEIKIWEWPNKFSTTEECPYDGFNRIGIKAQFQSLLQQYEVLGGKYGLRLKIWSNRPDMDAEQIDKLLHPTDPKVEPVSEDEVIFVDTLDFSNEDMYGNTYNFESYYEQEKLWFIVQELGEIKKLELYFYEDPGSFIYKNEKGEEEEIPWQSGADFLQTTVAKVNPNLFVKDVYLSFGLSLDNFDGNELLLYSPDNKKYKNTEKYNDSTNTKRLFLRWIYQDPDTSVIREGTIDDLVDNKERHDWIRWYRYDFGKGSADGHSGVYWSFWPSKDKYNFFTAELAPDTSRKIESIKCIASINGKIYKSNVLDFTTSDDLEDPATISALTDFDIVCDDGTFGNYFIYQLGGSLIDSTQRNIERSLSLRLEQSELDDADKIQKIVWKIPIQNTMIKISDTTKAWASDSEHYTYKEIPQDRPEYAVITFDLQGKREDPDAIMESNPPLTLNYFISPFYNASDNNNSIECTITTYGKSYHTEKVLRFGTAGTSGTDVTLTIDMEPGRAALRNFNPATIENDNIDTVKVTAHLYDADNHPINLDDYPDLRYTWDWVNDDYTIFTIDPSNPEDQTYECDIQLPKTSYQDSPKAHCSILRLKVEKWGDYDLIAYLPIPLQQSLEDEERDLHIVGPTEVWYDSEGMANYYKQPYLLMPIGASNSDAWDVLWGIKSLEWSNEKWPEVEKFYPTLSSKNMLIPLGMYMEGYSNNICLTAYDILKNEQGEPILDSNGNKQRGNVLWQQPILIYKNRYPAAMLNQWDGRLQIDEKNGSIMAPVIAAGRKDGNNTFSGVVIGAADSRLNAESALTRQTGVYGYHQGAMSYAFREDGTAFIGKDGQGRIVFDGNNATIESSRYQATAPGGMQIDLNRGNITMYANSNPTSNFIKIHSSNPSTTDYVLSDYPLQIGNRFSVDWDGTIHAKNGQFEGAISASYIEGGYISGASIESTDIAGGTIHGATFIAGSLHLPTKSTGEAGGRKYKSIFNLNTSEWKNYDLYYSPNGYEGTLIISRVGSREWTQAEIDLILQCMRDYEMSEFPCIRVNGISSSTTNEAIVFYDKNKGGSNINIFTATDPASQWSQWRMGYIGMIEGSDGDNTTYNIGIKAESDDTSVVLESRKNMRFSTINALYISANSINFTAEADDQHGIYARFA